MTLIKYPFMCFALLIGCSYSGNASSVTSASASYGTTICNQAGTTSASCSVSVPVGTQTAAASGSATSDWVTSAPGKLEATAFGYGSGATAQAAVSYSNLLIVSGATGSGDLQINFAGFQENLLNIPGSASVSAVSVGLGGSSTTVILPNGAPGAFSVVLPIAFNSPVLFSASFSATATGTFFHDGTFAADDADGILMFPSFVVTTVTGVPIPNASVSFVPEPSSSLLLAFGLAVVTLGRVVQPRLR